MLEADMPRRITPILMIVSTKLSWEIAAGAVAVAGLGAVGVWFALRKKPTAEELERKRRDFLVQSGRLVDGMMLDVYQVDGEDGRQLTLLLFNYRIGGVDYECSQDVTNLADVVDTTKVQLGFPCSVRYQPGNPQNSIVIAERWTGLRAGLPSFPEYHDPEPKDMSHMHPDKG
jgi:hypothetical protein